MRIKKLPRSFKYFEVFKQYKKLSYRVVFPFELRLLNTVGSLRFFSDEKHLELFLLSVKIVQIVIESMILFLWSFIVVLDRIVDITSLSSNERTLGWSSTTKQST
jgi:hypothetical protein